MRPPTEIKITPCELRKLQMVELDILLELDRVCRQNHISYFLCGGTLLGAVRHGGFIPWDDDVDVGFFRRDYERFCQVFRQEADPSRYFLQTWKTDRHYRWNYGKIRRVGTEYIRAGQEHMKYKTGISIDIFPYDYLPIDEELHRKILSDVQKKFIRPDLFKWELSREFLNSRDMRPIRVQARKCACLRKIAYSIVGKYQAPQWYMRLWYGLLSLLPGRAMAALLEKTACAYNDAEKYGGKGVRQFGYAFDWKQPSLGWRSDKLAERAEIEFEGFSLFTVKDTHWYLSSEFGENYMELPPKELRYAVAPASKIDFGNVFSQMEWCTEDYLHPEESING
ncbi:MAG: LicD family protein [Clostridium sp.]|nr:LicD family protein [Clostridium sp.]